jgi:AcrR family transcriptional regulator
MTNNDSHSSRKEREETFRRNIVLDIAEGLFADKGFDGTTVADIALASELAKGSLYQLFQSKEEIIAAIISRKIDAFISRIDEILSQLASPADIIRQIIVAKLEMVWESRKFAKIFLNELKGFHGCDEKSLVEARRSEMDRLFNRMEEVVSEGQRIGEIRSDISSEILLAAMTGFSNGVVFMWLTRTESLEIQDAIKGVQELFFNGAQNRERSIAS